MLSSPSQRKMGNLIVVPGPQLRLLGPFLMYLIISVGLIIAITYRYRVSLEDFTALIPAENHAATQRLDELGAQLFLICLGGIVVSGLMCLAAWTLVSHRIFGPMIQVRRKIEALRDGDYDTEFPIRKYDEFQEIAQGLDHLTKVLKASNRQPNKTKIPG